MSVTLIACGGRVESPEKQTAPPKESASVPAEAAEGISTYTATTLDGRDFDIATTRGRVILLNLWATWCGPCRFEIPELDSIHRNYASRGFEVIGVSVDEGGADVVREFVAGQPMSYPVVLDPAGKLASILETSVLPTSVLLDRTGRIVWKKIGVISPGDTGLESAIEAALGKG